MRQFYKKNVVKWGLNHNTFLRFQESYIYQKDPMRKTRYINTKTWTTFNAIFRDYFSFNKNIKILMSNLKKMESGRATNVLNNAFLIKSTIYFTKVFGYRPGNNSSAFNVSTHEGAGTFQALANKELTSPKANWASGL
ncbi:hypothetical protein H8356DRAFT_1361732 [Neocallimastix lanati (nom. inval.)]|nr:hypothetical protein H8356DRAFT_1361732 [Neocallimastix sp. JGI-2020a]